MKRYKILFSIFLVFATSCTELDIPPMNVIQDEDVFGSTEGVRSYMARIYSQMPIEDFRYSPSTGYHSSFYGPPSAITGEALSRDQVSGTESFSYWSGAYNLIRECNYFIETLHVYEENFSEEELENFLGEAYFIRGVTYFSLVKRYGGVPLIDEVLTGDLGISELIDNVEDLQLPRASEEEIWDFVAADFDRAYDHLPENNEAGRANRYAAAGFKSRAMLYAGSIAKYNNISLNQDGKQIVGVPATKASEYFNQSYDAALLLEGQYSLYKNSWAADNPDAQYQNFIELFFNEASSENIFIKQYQYPETVHGYDAMNLPRQLSGSGSVASETNPTLDFVEMFDGIPTNEDGRISVMDENDNYLLFENPEDLFNEAEPRLRATVILPGNVLKGEAIEFRRGIYTGDADGGIQRLLPEGSTSNYPDTDIVSSSAPPQTPYTLPDGSTMNPAGASGIFIDRNAGGSLTGFSVRKYINPDMPTSEVSATQSDQTWIELRYAEVLLNRAEAGFELYLAGEGSHYKDEALVIINEIRERAGAELADDIDDLNIIRNERRKELAFENKIYWDLRRWRIYNDEQNQRLYRVLLPFYAAEAGQYFFDDRTDERNARYTFDTRWYYNAIPQGAISKNNKLVQNPGY